MPYSIAFTDEDEQYSWAVVNWYVDISFIIDIFVNFLTAYYDEENKLITDNRTIARGYMRGWFVVDLITCFPFNVMAFAMEHKARSTTNYNKILRLLRLPRLYRLVRIARIIKIVTFLKNNKHIIKMQDFF